jgi:hypothetical protein
MTARDPPLDFGPPILDRIYKIFQDEQDEFCYPVNPG